MIQLPRQFLEPKYAEKMLTCISGLKGKIGLFGGSFDPIHIVHVKIAEELLASRIVDYIVFIPAAQNPLKTVIPTSDSDRAAMILLSIVNLKNCFISLLELERGDVSYTVDTLVELNKKKSADAELFWIIGSDCLAQLTQWKDIEKIASIVKFIAVQRDQVRTLEQWNQLIDSFKLPQNVIKQLKNNFIIRKPNLISASGIRHKLQLGLESQQVLPEVADYINKNRLYR
jgi:nicotinate-nucleotide adenylyltransferase